MKKPSGRRRGNFNPASPSGVLIMRSLGQPPLHMLNTSHSRQYLGRLVHFFCRTALLGVLDHLGEWPLGMLRFYIRRHVVVAGVKIAVISTTERRRRFRGRCPGHVHAQERPHRSSKSWIKSCRCRGVSIIENSIEKFSVGRRRHAAFVRRIRRVAGFLDQRQKLYVLRAISLK